MDYFHSYKKIGLGIFFIILVVCIIISFYIIQKNTNKNTTIKLGILFSTTGALAALEEPSLNAAMLAIDEINQKGGIDGTRILPVVYNPGSNWKEYGKLAEKMIVEDKVASIVGCLTSAARKEVRSVVEKHDSLLIYPAFYEGVEESPNIIYLGMAPNQYLVPLISWLMQQNKKTIYFVGSEFVWPRVSMEIMQHEIKKWDGKILGTRYLPVNSVDPTPIQSMVDDILAKKPEVVISMLTGDSGLVFLKELYTKVPSAQMPLVFSMAVIGFDKEQKEKFAGLHVIQAYQKSSIVPENKAFLKAYAEKYGSADKVNDLIVSAYSAIYLWSQAIFETPQIKPEVIREFMMMQSIASPAGPMYIDSSNAHTWRTVFIERINNQGGMDLAWSSSAPLAPEVFPDFKTKADWEFFEYQLYMNWGEAWGLISQ